MKILLANFNNALTDIEKELIKRGHTKLNGDKFFKEADLILLWNEVEKSGRPYVKKAKRLGIPVVIVQHGRAGTSRIFPPFNEKLLADKICLWGEAERKKYLSIGTPPEKLIVTGTPILKHLKPRAEHKERVVLFCPEHWCGGEVEENFHTALTLSQLKNVQIITKILPENNPNWYDNPVFSDRNKDGHLEICADVLSKADVVVSVMEGTFELMAQTLDIPVVLADIWEPKPCNEDERYLTYRRLYSNAIDKVDLKGLNEVVMYNLNHPEHLREERKQVAINEGGVNIEDPLGNIIKVIESYAPDKGS